MLNSCEYVFDDSALFSASGKGRSSARPKPGRSLGRAILTARKPFRAAVALLAESGEPSPVLAEIFDCTVTGPGALVEPPQLRLAWLLVNSCFAHAVHSGRAQLAPLHESAAWFFGGPDYAEQILSCLPLFSVRAAEHALAAVIVNQELWDLYPYVIEPHGHVSRSCLQEKSAREIRQSKKADGVYYTPSDLADFMVGEIADKSDSDGAWIDPACGTGVFVRSIIGHGKARYHGDYLDFVHNRVYGIDKSALATDSCAFVMLMELRGATRGSSPFHSWRRLKRNVACMDALHLEPSHTDADLFSAPSGGTSISSVFSESTAIFSFLVMNPPYAVADRQSTSRGAWLALSEARSNKVDLHLAFTEMMWRFESIEAAAAVLPLSVATNTTRTYKKIRDGFLSSNGRKEMLFFDREPQALFGEDIKTRNAVLFRFKNSKESIYTSQLLKWTAPQREQIFTADRTVSIDAKLCADFVPKLGSTEEADAYGLLHAAERVPLTRCVDSLSRRTLDQLVNEHKDDSASISIGGTAYNFINVFFSSDLFPIASTSKRLSTSPTIFIKFFEEVSAHAAFAVLSSRLAFWLWRVEGDGFHVTTDFVKNLPFWGLLEDDALRQVLAIHGKAIREMSATRATKSVNAGRETFAFHGSYESHTVREVERILLNRLMGTSSFSRRLDTILHAVTSIDGKTRRVAPD